MILLSIVLMIANVAFHISTFGSGYFNNSTPTDYAGAFFSAIVVYVLIACFLSITAAWVRKFSINGLADRFFKYLVSLQVFLILIQLVQLLIETQ